MHRLGLNDEARLMMHAELQGQANLADIAAAADSSETAAEIYLASLFIIDAQDAAERTYLDNLATALRLDPALVSQSEAKAGAAA